MSSDPRAPSDFYTGIVAKLYRQLRSETFDSEPYARFVERSGEPALELGCGDGDPLLDLRARGLAVEGLDSSADMLERCRAAAQVRGIDVTLHHATFESMNLRRLYRSIYLAGATFNLLPDDEAARAALSRIATHLHPEGSALIPPLFVPQAPTDSEIGKVREHVTDDGVVMRVTILDIHRDEAASLTPSLVIVTWGGSGGGLTSLTSTTRCHRSRTPIPYTRVPASRADRVHDDLAAPSAGPGASRRSPRGWCPPSNKVRPTRSAIHGFLAIGHSTGTRAEHDAEYRHLLAARQRGLLRPREWW
ncbi:MAG: class I SAM-dependent methyltransferase [Acidimicrobiales bacterium]